MKRILYFLSSRSLWTFLGVVGLALLVWFFGPLLAIGNVKPLANPYIRMALVAIIIGIWVIRFAMRQIRQAKRNAALINEMKVAQEPILKHVAEDSVMSKQFAEIDSILKNAKFNKSGSHVLNKFNNGQYLYQMPWYVVLGAAGSGKTTALKQSGLNFPLESSFGSSIKGLAGTRDCDWFLTDEAVLLDTAGRLSLHDSHDEHDAYDWKEFISLLKKYRPKQPINGVIVTVSVDDLLNNTHDFKLLANELRKRINEMAKYLGINFPVYLMITKLDMLNGFNEFFNGLSEEQRHYSLGFDFTSISNPEDSELLIGYVSKQLVNIEDTINASSIQVLNTLNETEQKNGALIFADEFAKMGENLLELFRELYKSSKFEQPILWRGIYFTSAQQDGIKFDPILNELSDSLGLANKYASSPSYNQPSKSFFLKNLFENVIFKESNLAGEDKAWYVKHQFLYWSGAATITGIGLVTSGLLANSYLNNSDYINQVSDKAKNLQTEANKVTQTSDLLQAVEFAQKVRQISSAGQITDPNSPPFSYRMGLYQGYAMDEVADASYQRVLQDSVMPLISYKLDELLRTGGNNIDKYNALKAYLMMYDKSHFDAAFMNDWLMKSFENSSTVKNAEQKQKIQDALKVILAKQSITPSVPYDKQLVDLRRNEIAQNDIASMILSDTFSEMSKSETPITPVSFETMGGSQSRIVFNRRSGKAISEAINPMYTKQAYMEYVLPGLLKSTAKLYKEDDWVLGNYASTKTNETDTLKQAQKAYFDRYISEWNNYLADIELKQPQNLREARDVAKILSDSNNSPLGNLIKGISDNTRLSLTAQVADKQTATTDKIVEQLLMKAGLSNAANTASNLSADYLNSVKQDPPVDNEFMDFHLLTSKTEGKPASIDEIVNSVKDLYEYLDVLNIAVEKGVDLPTNDPLFKYRSEVNRLPTPFRQMFDQFSSFVLNKSLDEMNERIKRTKEEQAQKEQQAKDEAAQKEQKDKAEAEKKEQEAKADAEKKQQELEKKEAQKVEDTKKQQEADLLVSLEKQLAPISADCQSVQRQGFPFNKMKTNVSIGAFSRIFSPSGNYAKFATLSPEAANLAHASTLSEVIARGGEYQKFAKVNNIAPITQTYFANGGETPSVAFSVRVMSLDKNVDSVVIDYDGSKYTYSHGPIVPYNLNWPTKTEDGQVSLTLFAGKKAVGTLKQQGPWAIFRLIEAGTVIKQEGNSMLVNFAINGKKLALDINTPGGRNPFNLSLLRSFQCP